MRGSLRPRLADNDPLAAYFSAAQDTAWNTYRYGAGIAQIHDDFDANDIFPLDANYDALSGVDYQKGCFVGQEVTSRMKRKGEVRKRILPLSFDGAPEGLTGGADVMLGDTKLGTLMGGAGAHYLAMIRLPKLAGLDLADTVVTCADNSAKLSWPSFVPTLEERAE